MPLVIRKVLLLFLPLQKKIRTHQENEAGRDPKSRSTKHLGEVIREELILPRCQTGSEKFNMRLERKTYPRN